jgi:hypothetical protein
MSSKLDRSAGTSPAAVERDLDALGDRLLAGISSEHHVTSCSTAWICVRSASPRDPR